MYKMRKKQTKHQSVLNALAMTRKVLLGIAGVLTSDGLAAPHISPTMRNALADPGELAEMRLGITVKQINTALAALKRRRLIAARRVGSRIEYTLTEKGRMAALRDMVRFAPDYTDGRLCMVMFDIPETERRVRDYLRHMLKDLGFIQRQYSVWISKQQTAQFFNGLIENMGAEEWVEVYEAQPAQRGMVDRIRIALARNRTRRDAQKRKRLIVQKNKLLPGIAGKKRFH